MTQTQYSYGLEQPRTSVERIRLVFELVELSEQMLRQRLRRKCPEIDDEEIEAEVARWYARRRGAEHGDSAGRSIDVEKRFG